MSLGGPLGASATGRLVDALGSGKDLGVTSERSQRVSRGGGGAWERPEVWRDARNSAPALTLRAPIV